MRFEERVARKACRLDCDAMKRNGSRPPCDNSPCNHWVSFRQRDHFVSCVTVLIEELEANPMDGVSALDRLKAMMVESAMTTTRGEDDA